MTAYRKDDPNALTYEEMESERDRLAWELYHSQCEVEHLRAERDAAEARGYQRAVDIVAHALAKARTEPRRQPTDRAGRITALGSLLNDLMNLEQFPTGEPTEGAQP